MCQKIKTDEANKRDVTKKDAKSCAMVAKIANPAEPKQCPRNNIQPNVVRFNVMVSKTADVLKDVTTPSKAGLQDYNAMMCFWYSALV